METSFFVALMIAFALTEAFIIVKTPLYVGKLLDEREAWLRLRIGQVVKRSMYAAILLVVAGSVLAFPGLAAWQALLAVALIGLFAEIAANLYFRWRENPAD